MEFNTEALKLALLPYLVLIKKIDSDHDRIVRRKNQVIKTVALTDIECWDVHQRGSNSVSDLFSYLMQNDTLILSTLKLVNGPDFL
jgi:hypothetical protein